MTSRRNHRTGIAGGVRPAAAMILMALAAGLALAGPAAAGRIAGGGNHTVAVEPDGTVWAWGRNDTGQLGDGGTAPSPIPVRAGDLVDVTAVSAAGPHNLALASDGTVWAWGKNNFGQLGDGTLQNRASPVPVMDGQGTAHLSDVSAVAAGPRHSLALKTDGTVWAWGDNHKGQTGDSPSISVLRIEPVEVSGLTEVVAIAAGAAHSLALKTDGTVWAWGGNGYGQLGDGTWNASHLPVQVTGLTDVAAIAAGAAHSLALKTDGTVWAWGYNGDGQLGDGAWNNRSQPVKAINLSGVSAIAAGGDHSMAMTSDGAVRTWGDNRFGQNGHNSSLPSTAADLSDVAAIAAGANHSLAMKADGAIFAWGKNVYGQLGDGTQNDRPTPIQTVTGEVVLSSIPAGDGVAAPGATDYPLYGLTLAHAGAGATLAGVSFTPKGTYLTSDIDGFRLRFSDDEVLDAGDRVLADAGPVNSGTVLSFSGFSESLPDGGRGHLSLTADIAAGAGGARTIRIPAPSASGLVFTEPAAVSGTPAGGDVQTFESAAVAVASDVTPQITAVQGVSDHVLYKVRLRVENDIDAVLTGLTATTGGDYGASDIAGFALRFSEDSVLDPNDPELTDQEPVAPGGELAFDGFSRTLPAKSEGFLFITMDAADSVTGGRRISVEAVDFDDIRFAADPLKTGDDPLPPGADHWLYIPAVVEVSTPAVPAGVAAPGTTDYPLYKIALAASDNDTELTHLTLFPQGSYTVNDIDRFRLYASGDDALDGSDIMIGEAIPRKWESRLEFNNFRWSVMKGETLCLILTADIAGGASAGHTLYIGAPGLDDLGFDPSVTVVREGAVLTSGGAATIPLSPYTGIAAGTDHNLALRTNGSVWAWGHNEFGQLGDGTTEDSATALPVAGLSDVVETAGGDAFSLALTVDGTVLVWGRIDYGQPEETGDILMTPVRVPDLRAITAIAAGDDHGVAQRADGTVWTWGDNRYGQLGDGTTFGSADPVRVNGLFDVVDVAAAGDHTLALRGDGSVWAWGRNDYGQLGDDTTQNRDTPVQCMELYNVAAIAAGNYHSLALSHDGSVSYVFAWGSHESGQLGDGAPASWLYSTYPISITGLYGDDVAAIAAGRRHSVALLADGTVTTWGGNRYGQLADATPDSRSAPMAVAGLPAVAAVAAGGDRTLALGTDGLLHAWGRNDYGQLGDGTRTDSDVPVAGGVVPTIAIAAHPVGEADMQPVDNVLYHLQLDAVKADATLFDLNLTTGGDYEPSDLSGNFRLYASADATLDDGDRLIGDHPIEPPGGRLRFVCNERIEKGATRHLFVTVDMGMNPMAGRLVFIDVLPLDDIGFAEPSVLKTGNEPLAAGDPQMFPTLTVTAKTPGDAPAPGADLHQNTTDNVVYRLMLSAADPDPATSISLTLTGLTLTTDGDYRPSDIAGDGFNLRYSTDGAVDAGDAVLAAAAPSEGRIIFDDLNQEVQSGEEIYLLVTADISATAGGGRTLSLGAPRLSDITFYENFVAMSAPDPLAAGGTMTFPMAVVSATAPGVDAAVQQGETDHPLYRVDLAVSEADIRLDGLTLTPVGNFAETDIEQFRLWYSEDETLTPVTDTALAVHDWVQPKTPLVFTELSQVLQKGKTGHFFLTADIGAFAMTRTVKVGGMDIEDLVFSDSVAFDPPETDVLAVGAVRTFPTPEVTAEVGKIKEIASESVKQNTPNHPVYRLDLSVADARTKLKKMSFITSGTYNSSDIEGFGLWRSDDGTLDENDDNLGAVEAAGNGETIAFPDLDLVLEPGAANTFFITADIGEANCGRTVGIADTPLDQLAFLESDNVILKGADPLPEGVETDLPTPQIKLTATEVKPATVEQGDENLVLYGIELEVSRAPTELTRATFVTAGDYQAGDLATGMPFELRFSDNDTLDSGDPTLNEYVFAAPGHAIAFTGLSYPLPVSDTGGYLFLTADIGPANGGRTLSIESVGFDQIGFACGEKTGDPLAAGGVQTFPAPTVAISAPALGESAPGQNVDHHVLYRLDLSVSDAGAVLESLTVTTAGTYLASDLSGDDPFKLWYSTDDGFSSGDKKLAALGFTASGNDLTFDGLSRTIQKDQTGYLFVTVDTGDAVGRSISIAKTEFDNIVFQYDDKVTKTGADPALAGKAARFPVPEVSIASAGVEAAAVEPKALNHILYRFSLAVEDVDAVLESVAFPMAGTYRASEIRTSCAGMAPCTPAVERELAAFKLWHSQDSVLDIAGDSVIGDSVFSPSGADLVFDGLAHDIPKGETGYLFLTANIGPAVPGRTVYVEALPFENIVVKCSGEGAQAFEAQKTGGDPLAAGGVQTMRESPGSLLSMDGVDDLMEIPYSDELNPDAFKVSVQAGVAHQQDADGDTVRTRQTIVASIDEAAGSGYEIFVDEDNKLKLRIGTEDGWRIVEGPEVVDNRFYDVTAAYDGGRATLSVDGNDYDAQDLTGFRPNASAPLWIGGRQTGDGDAVASPFNGQISELDIWDISAAGEGSLIAHYPFTPWSTLVDDTGNGHDGAMSGDPTWASVLSGLWLGQVEITAVNQVGFGGDEDTDTLYDAPNPFDMRLLLHVDAEDHVRLLRSVTLMQRRYTVENDNGTQTEMARRVLITDDDLLHEYEGVIRRDGKLVGVRLGSVFFDFNPSEDELDLAGAVRAGATISGELTLAPNHPRNPFRHRYHPDHGDGREIVRSIELAIDPEVPLERPRAGAFQLNGAYKETIVGLHNAAIKMQGTFRLERVSLIPSLNDGE